MILGHNHFLEKINNALAKNRLHPVWLVEGCQGIGKFSYVLKVICPVISKSFKTELYVLNAVSDLEYFYHDSTLEATFSQKQNNQEKNFQSELTVDDYFYRACSLNKQSNDTGRIAVSKVREVIEHLNYKASFDNLRIVVIDSINELNQSGLQALLKTLEDSEPNTVFFLICHNLTDVPKTILSRAIKVKLNNPNFITFDKIITSKYPNIDSKVLSEIYLMSGTNPRLAFRLLSHSKSIYLVEELFRHFAINDTSYTDLKNIATAFDNIHKDSDSDSPNDANIINFTDLAMTVIQVFNQSIIQSKFESAIQAVSENEGSENLSKNMPRVDSKVLRLATKALREFNFDMKLSKLKKIQSLLINNNNLKPSQQIIAAVFSLR